MPYYLCNSCHVVRVTSIRIAFGLLIWFGNANSSVGEVATECARPSALKDGAFDAPMTFSWATNKGNMSTSAWIVASGLISPETPQEFRTFMEAEGWPAGQLVLNSPGGNLAAGLELGRLIRKAGLTTHIGTTVRTFDSYDASCDSWYDTVEAGFCASSCAYAFLGGEVRFVNSPYYPTIGSLLGFHQFYSASNDDLITPEEAAAIQASTLSLAQAITGQIVMYAVEMGVDPRIVAFASATSSNDLYFPTPEEVAELSVASGSGLGDWLMEPYNEGLIIAARPRRSDSMLQAITMFCRKGGQPSMLISMDLRTTSYPDPGDLPLKAVEIKIDGQLFSVRRHDLQIHYGDDTIFITTPMNGVRDLLVNAQKVEFSLDAARAMGNFREESDWDNIVLKSLNLAWRNCI
jgi:hypothetical protein